MMLLKLADEVYELQGWVPPAKALEGLPNPSRSDRTGSARTGQTADKGGKTSA